MTISITTNFYVRLPLCLDDQGHWFAVYTTPDRAVCTRCGLIRKPEES